MRNWQLWLRPGKLTWVMLPEPFVTSVLAKNSDVRMLLDITEEWKHATAKPDAAGVELTMGLPRCTQRFRRGQQSWHLILFSVNISASTAFVNEHIDEAA